MTPLRGSNSCSYRNYVIVMLKTWPLCTGAESNFGEFLGEVEKNSFIALPGKGGHSRLLP